MTAGDGKRVARRWADDTAGIDRERAAAERWVTGVVLPVDGGATAGVGGCRDRPAPGPNLKVN